MSRLKQIKVWAKHSLKGTRPLRLGSIALGDQELKIRQVLKELQERSILNANRRLVHLKEDSARLPIFQVQPRITHRPKIGYRFGNGAFDENSLRFILMHEEKHIRSPLSWLVPLIAIVTMTCLVVWRFFAGAGLRDMLISFLLLVATWYLSIPMLRYGEVCCDLWAARRLKNDFGVRVPSEVALKALTWPEPTESRFKKGVRSLTVGPIHPSKARRVERIAKDVDAFDLDPDLVVDVGDSVKKVKQ